jgi:hypothetical protein
MQVKWEQVGCSMLMPESCGDFLFGRRAVFSWTDFGGVKSAQ